MKKLLIILVMLTGIVTNIDAQIKPDLSKLKIVIIRHGEKPPIGDNLSCQGLNRANQLPAVIASKFGVPDFVYVPALLQGKRTYGARMFETVIPLVAKYNLKVNTKHETQDYNQIATDIKSKTGIVLVVWEHKAIPYIVQALGIDERPVWASNDFDSILIITFVNGKAILTKDKEGLTPSVDCGF
jgi:hypothetical protein